MKFCSAGRMGEGRHGPVPGTSKIIDGANIQELGGKERKELFRPGEKGERKKAEPILNSTAWSLSPAAASNKAIMLDKKIKRAAKGEGIAALQTLAGNLRKGLVITRDEPGVRYQANEKKTTALAGHVAPRKGRDF